MNTNANGGNSGYGLENEMSRELFRGKRKDNGEWVYGSLITHISEVGEGMLHTFIEEIPSHWNTKEANNHFWEHRRYVVGPETVGQFVCNDKNGNKVFEEDKALADMTELTGEKDMQEVDAVVKGGFDFWDVDGHTFVKACDAGDFELIEEKND